MAAKIFNKFKEPKYAEFSRKDLVVDIKNGDLYYKSNLGVHKVPSEVSSDTFGIPPTSPISTGRSTFKLDGQREGDSAITGSLTLIGNLSASGTISSSGNLYALLEDNNTTAFKTVIYDTTTGQFFITGSYGGGGGGSTFTADGISGSWQSQDFANLSAAGISGSFLLNTTDTLDGDLTVTGTITAQEFHTEFVSSSIIFTSGSTQFGNSADDIHTFSGSINVKDAGHITSSGNISASGTLYGSEAYIKGDITGSNRLLIQKSNDQGDPTAGTSDVAIFQNNDAGQDASISIIAADTKRSSLHFGRHDDIDIGSIKYIHDGHSTPDQFKFKINGQVGVTFNSILNRGRIGVGVDFTPTDYFHAQGALSGGGLTISSSNGGNILVKAANTILTLDRTATDKKLNLEFNTAETTNWTLGNISESNDNFYIYSGDGQTDKHISLTPISTTFHTNVTASGDISSSGKLYGGLTNTNQSNLLFYNDSGGELTYASTSSFLSGLLSSSYQIESDISGAFTLTSSSIATNIATNTSNITTLNSAGLLSSSNQIATDISGAFNGVTGSFLLNTTDTFTGQLDVVGSITSSGDISSSGFMYADIANFRRINIDGANINYNSSDDILTFGDNVTLGIGTGPSGNISDTNLIHDGSNFWLRTITGNAKIDSFDGNIILNPIASSKGVIISGSTPSTFLDVRGHITSSGNISASGTLYFSSSLSDDTNFKTLVYDTSTGKVFHTGSYGGGGGGGGGTFTAAGISGSWQGQNFVSASQTFLSTGQRSGDSAITGSLEVTSNITSSGNISASGTLYAGLTNTNQSNLVFYNSSGGELTYAASSSFLAGLISSSAQIATDISGSFTFLSSSLSASVAVNTADILILSSSLSASIATNTTNVTSLTSVTSSYTLNSQTSSFAPTSATASYVQNSTTSSFTLNSQTSSFAPTSATSSYTLNSQTSSFAPTSATASYVQNSATSSYTLNSQTSSFTLNSQTSSFAPTSATSSYTLNSQTSSFALTSATASYVQNSATSSFLLNTTDTLTGDLTVTNHITASGAISASGKLYGGLASAASSYITYYDTTTGELTYGPLTAVSPFTAAGISGSFTITSASIAATLIDHGDSIAGNTSAILTLNSAGLISASVLDSPTQGQARLTTNGVAAAAVDLGLETTDTVTFAAITSSVLTSTTNLILNSSGSNNAYDSIIFQTHGAERMRISGSGNIGIGTALPDKKLVVAAGASGTGNADISASGKLYGGLRELPTSQTVFYNTSGGELSYGLAANSFTAAGISGSWLGQGVLSSSAQIATDISGAINSATSSLSASIVDNYLLNTTDTLDGDLTVTGTITAQEFHTEFVSASIIFESGSTQFGNSSDDIHTFSGSINVKDEGHITASGNISASGKLYGKLDETLTGNTIFYNTSNGLLSYFPNPFISSSQVLENLNAGTVSSSAQIATDISGSWQGQNFVSASQTFLSTGQRSGDSAITGSLILSGSGDTKLTVKGNITASGNIKGGNLLLGNNVTDASIELDGDFGGGALTLKNKGNNQDINFQVNKGGSNITALAINGATGDITASGNISASGNILANKYHSNGYNVLRYKANGDQVLVGYKDKPTQITGSSLILGETPGFHVTASGNISASGDVYASNIIVPGGGRISFDDDDTTDQFIKGDDHNITIDGDDFIKLKADTAVNFVRDNGDINVSISPNSGHITASGAISASGKLYGGLASSATSNALYYSTTTGELTYGVAFTAAGISGSGVSQFPSTASFANLSSSLSSNYTLNSQTSSYALASQTSSYALASATASYAPVSATASYVQNSSTSSFLLNTTDTLDGDLTVTGTITAQEFHTEFVSASILFTSGSTQFGNSADDIHTFSGSINVKDGHITASGNISASGKLYGGLANTTTTDFVLYNTSTGELSYDNPGILSSSAQIATNISGAIDAATGSLLGSYTFLSSSAQIADDISGSWQGQEFVSASQTFLSTGQRSGDSAITGSLTVGNITSSGNISASGYLHVGAISGSGSVHLSGLLSDTTGDVLYYNTSSNEISVGGVGGLSGFVDKVKFSGLNTGDTTVEDDGGSTAEFKLSGSAGINVRGHSATSTIGIELYTVNIPEAVGFDHSGGTVLNEDTFVIHDVNSGSAGRILAENIPLSAFNNNVPFASGTVTSVTSSNGLSISQVATVNPQVDLDFISLPETTAGNLIDSDDIIIMDNVTAGRVSISSFENSHFTGLTIFDEIEFTLNGNYIGDNKVDESAQTSTQKADFKFRGGNGINLSGSDASRTIGFNMHNNYEGNFAILAGNTYNSTQVGNLDVDGDVVAYASSDKRLKDNIKPISDPINKILKIGGYTFDWNKKQDTYNGHDVGVIAQEVEKVLPEVVETRKNGYKAVKYEKMVPLLIESIKNQQKQIDELKELVTKLINK